MGPALQLPIQQTRYQQQAARPRGTENVYIDNPTVLMQALDWHAQGMDFSDALHLSHSARDNPFYTFDQKLISTASKVTSYTLKKP
jgi:hypothetical protein